MPGINLPQLFSSGWSTAWHAVSGAKSLGRHDLPPGSVAYQRFNSSLFSSVTWEPSSNGFLVRSK